MNIFCSLKNASQGIGNRLAIEVWAKWYLPPSGCEPYREAIDRSACYLSGSHIHTDVPIKEKKGI